MTKLVGSGLQAARFEKAPVTARRNSIRLFNTLFTLSQPNYANPLTYTLKSFCSHFPAMQKIKGCRIGRRRGIAGWYSELCSTKEGEVWTCLREPRKQKSFYFGLFINHYEPNNIETNFSNNKYYINVVLYNIIWTYFFLWFFNIRINVY